MSGVIVVLSFSLIVLADVDVSSGSVLCVIHLLFKSICDGVLMILLMVALA